MTSALVRAYLNREAINNLVSTSTCSRNEMIGDEYRVLYVGGLAETTSDHQLRDLLGAYGAVARAFIVRHKYSGKSACYGFVEMGSGKQAADAVVALEGALFEGHSLRLYVTPYVSTDLQTQSIRRKDSHR
jgi:RNA recognition motif-containing protein